MASNPNSSYLQYNRRQNCSRRLLKQNGVSDSLAVLMNTTLCIMPQQLLRHKNDIFVMDHMDFILPIVSMLDLS